MALLVEGEAADAARLGDWLEDAGINVMHCPGPQLVSDCPGIRGHSCSLVEGSDMVILDERLLTEVAGDPRTSSSLVRFYLANNKPVLILTHPQGWRSSFDDGNLITVDGLTSQSVLGAIHKLMPAA